MNIDNNMAKTSVDTTIAVLGFFEVLAKIGQGGMGKVYKAIDTRTQKICALKVLENVEILPRFFREAQSISSLSHPNIIKFYEFGQLEENNHYYISMEYIEGRPFSDLIGNISHKKSMDILCKIANALQYIHLNNLIHRDIKPSNIIISQSGKPYLVDFGIVKFIHADQKLTQKGSVLGTPGYMSPEQINGRNIDHRTDIYSMGIVLYEVLTQKLPFGSDFSEVLKNFVYKPDISPRTINKKVSKDLEYICCKALSYKKTKRYQNICEFNNDLNKYMNGQSVYKKPLINSATKALLIFSLLLATTTVFVILFFTNKSTPNSIVTKLDSALLKNNPEEKVSIDEQQPNVLLYYKKSQENINTAKTLDLMQRLEKTTFHLCEVNDFIINNSLQIEVDLYEKFIVQINELRLWLLQVLDNILQQPQTLKYNIEEWQKIVRNLDNYFISFAKNWRRTIMPSNQMIPFVHMYLSIKRIVYEEQKQNITIATSDYQKYYEKTYLLAVEKTKELLEQNPITTEEIESFVLDVATYPFFLKKYSIVISSSRKNEANQYWKKIIAKLQNIIQNIPQKDLHVVLFSSSFRENPDNNTIYFSHKNYFKCGILYQKYLNKIQKLSDDQRECFVTICLAKIAEGPDFIYSLQGKLVDQNTFIQKKFATEKSKRTFVEIAWSLKEKTTRLLLIPNYEKWIIHKTIAAEIIKFNYQTVAWTKVWCEAYYPHILRKLNQYENNSLPVNETPFKDIQILVKDIDSRYQTIIQQIHYCEEYLKQ